MPYILIVAALILLFVVLHKMTELDMKTKLITSFLIAVVLFSLYLFEQNNTNKANEEQKLIFAFNQGKVLLCDDADIDNKHYNYVAHSFIGKKGTVMFSAPNISIYNCKIKP